jgi:hypothetical protein
MPTYLEYTVADLDAEIQAIEPKWANRSDYTTLRDRALRRAMSEYNDSLITGDDAFAKASMLSAPITLGTALINTTVGDIFGVDLPADALAVAGDAILVQKSATTEFFSVPRMNWTDIVPSGGSQTAYAFWQDGLTLYVYTKDSNFDATASAAFDYFRRLDVTQSPTSIALDIKDRDFGQIVDSTLAFLESYI